MAGSQIQGFTQANIMEVEAATKAARVTLRPEDYGSLGIYSVGNTSGLVGAGAASNATIFSARWTHATNLCLVKRVTLSMAAGPTAFAAGVALFNLFVARSWTVSDSGQTSLVPTGNMSKLRTTGMGTSLFANSDIQIAGTAAVTAGTRTLDGNPLGGVACGVTNVAGIGVLAPYAIWEARPGEHPVVLAQNEGLVLRATVPATGTWQFGVKMDWTEITAY